MLMSLLPTQCQRPLKQNTQTSSFRRQVYMLLNSASTSSEKVNNIDHLTEDPGEGQGTVQVGGATEEVKEQNKSVKMDGYLQRLRCQALDKICPSGSKTADPSAEETATGLQSFSTRHLQ
ncbi:uncharacterized [Tachysurus ichikawai]